MISLPYNITDEQRNAFKSTKIESGVISSGNAVLYAFGKKPSIDIPVIFSIGGDY